MGDDDFTEPMRIWQQCIICGTDLGEPWPGADEQKCPGCGARYPVKAER